MFNYVYYVCKFSYIMRHARSIWNRNNNNNKISNCVIFSVVYLFIYFSSLWWLWCWRKYFHLVSLASLNDCYYQINWLICNFLRGYAIFFLQINSSCSRRLSSVLNFFVSLILSNWCLGRSVNCEFKIFIDFFLIVYNKKIINVRTWLFIY